MTSRAPEAAAIAAAATLGSAPERRRFLAAHRELATAEGVRSLDAAVSDLLARDPRRALVVADLACAAAARLDERSRLIATTARARALFRCARYREADALLREVASAHERRGELREAGLAQMARMGSLTNLGDLHEALRAAETAHRAFAAGGTALDRAKLEGNCGIVLHRMGRLREALACNARARPVFARHGDRFSAAILDLNRAQSHSQLGEAARAEALFESARRTFVEAGHAVLVASVDYNRACDDVTRGRYDRAWRGLEAARAEFERLGDADAVALADLDLAEIAWRLGSHEAARTQAARARAGFARIGAAVDVARARCVEALAQAREGHVRRAAESLRAAADAFDAEGHVVRAAQARLDLATLMVDDRPDEASRLANESARELTAAGLRGATLRAELVEGLASAKAGSARARSRLEAVVRSARAHALPDVEWQALSACAALDLRAGRIAAARRALDRAADCVDHLRDDLRRLEPARWVLRDAGPLYEQAITAWLAGKAPGRAPERAFVHAERSRSRALADAVALGQRQAPQPLQLARRADMESPRPPRRSSPAARATDGWTRLTGSESPTVARRGESLRGALRRGEALLEYQRAGDVLWAFVVTSDRVQAQSLGSCTGEVDELVVRLDFHLGKFAVGAELVAPHLPALRSRVDEILDRIGALLLQPVLHLLPGRRLIVAPTRELHRVPFAALRVDGTYAVESLTTTTTPSALVLALLRLRRPRGSGALVAGVGSDELPQVHREARDVARLLAGSRLLLGDDVTREAFHEGVRGRSVVHLATHGIFRPERPTLSSLQLAGGPLTLADIARLPLAADLVTLTACDSGRSRVGPGDDLTGLARAFLDAGARNALVSLWGLDDAHSRRVMRTFYRRLPSEGPAEALRAAVLQSARTSPHPFYWAPFSLVGAG